MRAPVRVVILGGGFAGVHAAVELERAIPAAAAVEITGGSPSPTTPRSG